MDAPRCKDDQSGTESCRASGNINLWLTRTVCLNGARCWPGDDKCTFQDECVPDLRVLCGTLSVCEGDLQKSCDGRREGESVSAYGWAPNRTVWRYEPCPEGTRCEQSTVSCLTYARCVPLTPGVGVGGAGRVVP